MGKDEFIQRRHLDLQSKFNKFSFILGPLLTQIMPISRFFKHMSVVISITFSMIYPPRDKKCLKLLTCRVTLISFISFIFGSLHTQISKKKCI